ncbi:MAG TPA: cupin domain-containing protein [Solirubrobacteraceae bacterium]|nr:cupin domain-containing protein [Solirubrobacteraceae bacterium]
MEQGFTRASLVPDSPERFVRLRHELGISTFGINQIAMGPGQRGRIHRHAAQEELYLVWSGTLTLRIEDEEIDVGAGELVRVAPGLRRQLINRGPDRVVVVALGGAGEHEGRDGEAFASWDQERGAPPQEVPAPADLDPSELRA